MGGFFSGFFYSRTIASTGSGLPDFANLATLNSQMPASSANRGQEALVLQSTLIPPTRAGIYRSDGTQWVRIEIDTPVEDNLGSSSSTSALSANQGRILSERISSSGGSIVADNIEYLRDATTATYYLGIEITANPVNWAIRRNRLTGNTVTQQIADEVTNSTFATFADAWASRTTLTYV